MRGAILAVFPVVYYPAVVQSEVQSENLLPKEQEFAISYRGIFSCRGPWIAFLFTHFDFAQLRMLASEVALCVGRSGLRSEV